MLQKIVISIVVCSILFTGCLSNQNGGNSTSQITSTTSSISVPATSVSNDSTPITLKLTLSKIPVVNEETTLRVEVNCIFDAPDTNVSIIMPSDSVMTRGVAEKRLDLKANTPQSYEATIKFLQHGNYTITARAKKVIDRENSWGDMDVLYLSIGDTISTLQTYISATDGGSSQLNSGNNQTR
jgi:hypothetical protein